MNIESRYQRDQGVKKETSTLDTVGFFLGFPVGGLLEIGFKFFVDIGDGDCKVQWR